MFIAGITPTTWGTRRVDVLCDCLNEHPNDPVVVCTVWRVHNADRHPGAVPGLCHRCAELVAVCNDAATVAASGVRIVCLPCSLRLIEQDPTSKITPIRNWISRN